MADVIVNLEFATGLNLPYESGAEAAFAPAEAAAFTAASAAAGAPITLFPGFDLPLDELSDFLSAARQGGVEPPDLFAWYSLLCAEEVAGALVTALESLPFVVQAAIQPPKALAGWEVVTDSHTSFERYLRMSPAGVNGYAVWQVPGGSGRGARFADVEHGWDLNHPDLQPAHVVRLTFLPPVRQKDVDHGTQALGIVAAQPDGARLTGIAPAAALAVAYAGSEDAAAILRAARHVGRGGIVLIELGEIIPEREAEDTGHVPLEHDPKVKAAILAATALGVLVVEPAGNGSVNLDTDPRYPDLRVSATSVDSGALMVAAAETDNGPDGFPSNIWRPADFTSGGARVNCFAPGAQVVAPKTGAINGIAHDFSGTSAASAIVAGVATALQGVAIASRNGVPLTSTELHARLRDPQFGTRAEGVTPSNMQSIGIMPDLEKLIEGLGVRRLPPVSAFRTTGGRIAVVRARPGDVTQLEILEGPNAEGNWVKATTSGAGSRVAVPLGHAIGLCSTVEGGIMRIDAVTPSDRGGALHRPFVLDLGLGIDQPWRAATVPTADETAFKLSAPMTVAATGSRLLVSGLAVNNLPLVVIANRKTGSREVTPTRNVDPTAPGDPPEYTYPDVLARFECPPVIFDHGGSMVLAGVDQDGWIRFAAWTAGVGWTSLEFVAQGLDPAHPPAIASDGPSLHIVGYDSVSQELREIVRSADADAMWQWSTLRAIAAPALVTWGVPIEPATPISLASDGAGTLMLIALTAAGLPVASVRLPGLDWTPLFLVPCLTTFAVRAGIAVASPTAGLFVAAACDESGSIYTASWTVLGWSPFVAI